MRRILRQLGRADGTEILETALVLPVLFMFLLGIVWFGRAFQVYATLTQAAQRGAVTAARASCATCGNTFPDDTAVSNAVYAVTDASKLDSSVIAGNPIGTPLPDCPAPAPPQSCSPPGSSITICRSVVINGNSTQPQCGVVVTFSIDSRSTFHSHR